MSTVLVTGAASGIGRATALRLAGRGHRVLAYDVDADGLGSLPSTVETHAGDVTDEARVREVVPADLDALVNCAAAYELGAVEDVDWERVEAQFRVNVFGTLAVTRAALPTLRANGGCVVTLSSVLGRTSLPLHGIYAGTKHALEGLFDALRAEQSAVDVVLVEPGPVDTGLNERAKAGLARDDDSAHRDLYDRVLAAYDPGGVPPDRVARVVVRAIETADPDARYVVTGQARLLLVSRLLLPERVYDRVALARVRNRTVVGASLELAGDALHAVVGRTLGRR
ncbi:SDR family NAD(P)-dependent oxidoreductase [Salinigranum salinum]|uniref:SDR family NAD(P)-dependent oxidoreductase n=1 Tax=Salinigranum salinum TaxID=1364937 RepID=UPI0012610676|nr:SDR family NAD(P)-dependent oxidoreductase [Salinigranum salinum]